MNRFKIQAFLWTSLGLLAIFGGFPSYAAARSASVDIFGPPAGEDLLPNTRYTLFIRVNYHRIWYDPPATETKLWVKVWGGEFVDGNGTFVDHFDTVPQAGSDPAIYVSSSEFEPDGSKIAVVTVETSAYGDLRIEASALVSGFLLAETAEAAPFDAHIQPGLPAKDPSTLFKNLASARQGMAKRFIQFYNSEIDIDETVMAQEAVTMMSSVSGLVGLTGTMGLLANMGPCAALFGSYMGYLDPFSQFVQFTFDLMDEWKNATWRTLWNNMYGGGVALVDGSEGNPGYLNRLVQEMESEMAAWLEEDYTAVIEQLEAEQQLLMCIKMTAENVLGAMAGGNELSYAFFASLWNWAESELEAAAEMRAAALVLKYGILSRAAQCMTPEHNATGIALENPLLKWGCSSPSDSDKADLSFAVSLKKASESEYQSLDLDDPWSVQQTLTISLDEGATYDWEVDAVVGFYEIESLCGDKALGRPFQRITISGEESTFTTESSSPLTADITKFSTSGEQKIGDVINLLVDVSLTPGLEAKLLFEMLDSDGNHLRYLGAPATLYNSGTGLGPSFSSLHAVEDAKLKATLEDGSGNVLDTALIEGFTIANTSFPLHGYPSLVAIEVIGVAPDGTAHTYGSGPIKSVYEAWLDTSPRGIGLGQPGGGYLSDAGDIIVRFYTWDDGP